MSYNIFHSVGQDDVLNLTRTAQVIKNQKVDIVGLQVLLYTVSACIPSPCKALLHDIQAYSMCFDHAIRRCTKCT